MTQKAVGRVLWTYDNPSPNPNSNPNTEKRKFFVKKQKVRELASVFLIN